MKSSPTRRPRDVLRIVPATNCDEPMPQPRASSVNERDSDATRRESDNGDAAGFPPGCFDEHRALN